MKRHVHCRFEEDLLQRVDEAALLLGLTRTGFIKLACRTYLRSVRTNKKNLKAQV
jgi:metal-responsive CopG/Arc/MetJ family transcriptional regulator